MEICTPYYPEILHYSYVLDLMVVVTEHLHKQIYTPFPHSYAHFSNIFARLSVKGTTVYDYYVKFFLVEEPLGIHNDVCSLESKSIQTRLDNFEEKITWVVQELQMIRKTLEITTKAIQSTISRPLLIPNKDNTLQPIYTANVNGNGTVNQPSVIRPFSINQKGLTNISAPFAVHYPSSQVPNGCNSDKRDDYQSNGSSDDKVSFPEDSENRESHSETASKSLSDDYDSDSQLERGRISRDGNESNQSSRDWNVYNELMTTAPQLKNLHSDSISCLDVIYLWEYGTDEMLPIRLWNEAELESGGDVIRRWQQIMHLFKENCRGSLRTFVNKFTGADGKLMSVKDVLASRGQDIANNNSPEVGENKLSDTYSVASGSQSETGSKMVPYRGASSTSNSSNTSLQCDSQQDPCFILPRKINGQKVSAKDVIRLWEDGFCNIPPIKTWTPSQKLKQQSKISRWKKIVDIFKTECNSDMKLFEMVYKNECGALLPIAAIISKHEHSQSAADIIGQPTMSTVNTSTLDIKVDNFKAGFSDGSDKARHYDFRGPYNRLHELGREWDLFEAQSCKERRAFTIRQVENWQRNIIQPHENGAITENLQSITLPKIFEEKADSHEDRAVPHLNHASIHDAQSIKSSGMVIKEASGIDCAKSDFMENDPQNLVKRLQGSDGFNPIVRIPSCSEERKEPEESSMSDSSDNSSCKDIDVTGSITSESSVPSKSYSPVTSKLGKDLKSRSPLNPEIKKPQSTAMNKGTTGQSLDCVRVSDAEKNAKAIYHTLTNVNPELYNVLPETDDPIEVLNLWEHGSESYPPVRFLAMKPELIRDSRLAAWRKFIGIFHYFCNGDKQILLQKYSDEHGRLYRVSEILQGFGSVFSQRQSKPLNVTSTVATTIQTPTSSLLNLAQASDQLDTKPPRTDINIYTLPRKINGHKVSAKDVIHIWNHGLKNIPAVKSWLPNQKVRQQSKISRWKKIVEIFEVDCACNMQNFEKKYSNKSGDLLPIAAIISKYEAEKTAIDGDSGLNIKIDTMT